MSVFHSAQVFLWCKLHRAPLPFALPATPPTHSAAPPGRRFVEALLVAVVSLAACRAWGADCVGPAGAGETSLARHQNSQRFWRRHTEPTPESIRRGMGCRSSKVFVNPEEELSARRLRGPQRLPNCVLPCLLCCRCGPYAGAFKNAQGTPRTLALLPHRPMPHGPVAAHVPLQPVARGCTFDQCSCPTLASKARAGTSSRTLTAWGVRCRRRGKGPHLAHPTPPLPAPGPET